LRVSGLAWGQTVARNADSLEPDVQWRKGEARKNGQVHVSSGFNLFVANARSKRSAISKALQFMNHNASLFGYMLKRNGSILLDFGVMAGSDISYAPTVTFPLAFMRKCLLFSTEIEVSSYPCSNGK
jgi:hypothetical protein